tara:strand:+ start:53 stop:415 length:363 start_codon:yes stop_codon:yes gene_type:complete
MIILKAQVEGIQSRKDKTVKLTLSTQELPPKEAGVIFSLQNELVGVGISRNELTDSDVELLRETKYGVDNIPNQKSQAKRIRDVLYILWKQNPEGFESSEAHYQNKTESIFQHLKNQIND